MLKMEKKGSGKMNESIMSQVFVVLDKYDKIYIAVRECDKKTAVHSHELPLLVFYR